MRCQFAAMRAVQSFGRQNRERIDPAGAGVEHDSFAIGRDQFLRQRTERDDELAIGLAEARASLKVRDAVPQQRGETAAGDALARGKTQAAEDRAGLAAGRQDVMTQIGGCSHRAENVNPRNGTRRLAPELRALGQRYDLVQLGRRNALLHPETPRFGDIGFHLQRFVFTTLFRFLETQKGIFTEISRWLAPETLKFSRWLN